MESSVAEYVVGPTALGCLVMAGVTLFTGGYHLAIFSSRRRETIHLSFALLCASVAAYDLFSAGLYESASVTEGMGWQRLQLSAVTFISIFVTWFVLIFTERLPHAAFKWTVSWFLFLLALSLIVPGELSLTLDRPSIKQISIPGLFRVTYYEVDLGVIYLVGVASSVVVYSYLLVLLVEYRRRTARGAIRWMIVSHCLYFACVLSDSLVGAGVLQFVYVSEYAFFLVVLAMSGLLLSEFVRARAAVEQMNEVLDRRVVERTRELQLASEATTRALSDLQQKDERLAANIHEARLFQEKTLPTLPRDADFGIAYLPLEVVSGDMFDICELGPAQLRIFLADVTGHGVQAAMRTTLLKAEYDRLKNAYTNPASLLEALNRRLVELFPDREMMSTAVCLDVAVVDGGAKATLANAGGPDPVVCGRAGVREMRAEGGFLGVHQDDWSLAREFLLEPGDTIVVFTDGLSEQFNPSRERFDPVGAASALPFEATANDLVQLLLVSLHEFRKSVSAGDDVTVIAFRIPAATHL